MKKILIFSIVCILLVGCGKNYKHEMSKGMREYGLKACDIYDRYKNGEIEAKTADEHINKILKNIENDKAEGKIKKDATVETVILMLSGSENLEKEIKSSDKEQADLSKKLKKDADKTCDLLRDYLN